MKTRVFISTNKFPSALYFVAFVIFFLGIIYIPPSYGEEKTKSEKINASVNETLERFYTQVKDGREVAKRANGLLILPNVGKGAFIIGAEYGRGALRVGGITVDYYSMMAGSIGFQIGGGPEKFPDRPGMGSRC